MKKGLLQRASKNWEEIKLISPPLEIKEEPTASIQEPPQRATVQAEASKVNSHSKLTEIEIKQQRKNQSSMIAIRKDYNKPKTPASSIISQDKFFNCLGISQKASQSTHGIVNLKDAPVKKDVPAQLKTSYLQSPATIAHKGAKPKEPLKRSSKPNISILERHDYDKSPKVMKIDKFESSNAINEKYSAMEFQNHPVTPENLKNLIVPIEQIDITEYNKKKKLEREQLKVIVSPKIENPINVRQELSPEASTLRQQPTLSTESKDSQNTPKINNKINIIFQLNDNSKSLRKNIILHRRTPKKMVQKITIKEANNNSTKTPDESVPDKILCTTETQTDDEVKVNMDMNMSNTSPLVNEATEHLFFEEDILICLQRNIISFYDFHRLSSLLKKGETDFRLIDRIPRRLHDVQVDSDNKFQRLCYNDQNPLPIYVEMRAKQKELNDLEMCPMAFLYCNVYYVDQQRAKFSSVHLDTVKSVVEDITYTTVPKSSYFIMAWNEKSLDAKGLTTGIVKYKLTPNLDLAKLASIRQFPKLNYRIKQMNCGKDSQLITTGDSQVSIFNYDNGDLLISLDLMKSYGTNLTTFEFEANYLFMVYLADSDESHSKRIIVIGVNRFDGNTFKVIQSTPVKVDRSEKIVSRSITSTNHLVVTFSSGSSLMMYLDNFRNIHLHRPLDDSMIVASNDFMMIASGSNVGLCHFTEFFLNN